MGPAGDTQNVTANGNGIVATQTKKRPRTVSQTSPIESHPPPEHVDVKDDEPDSSSKPRPTTQQLLLEQYVTRDLLHAAALNTQITVHNDLIRSKRKEVDYYQQLRRLRQENPAAVFGYGYAGYGNGHTPTADGKTRIMYPCQRKRPGGRKSRELRISRTKMNTQAEQLEELVPVRLDIDWDKIKLRDTFTWNLHDRVITPELFAEQLVEDFKLPINTSTQLINAVSQSVSDQIQDFYPQVFIPEEALDPHLPYFAYKNDEMRILIKLNITIGQHTLVDQFEWEANNVLNSPEEFARQMTRELSLSGEFTTAIAHCIREQTQLFTKSLYLTGHPFDGRPVEDADLQQAFLPSPLTSVFRPVQHAKEYTPYLYELNEAELERAEKSLSREQRRQKRSVNRRGGPTLPDLKDRQRTVRTLIVSSVLPGAAESFEESRIIKRPEGTVRPGRRATAGNKDGDSDLSSSEDSAPNSPALSNAHVTPGTARTRGMRGAASAAQIAMRATLGRSATPEASMLHHHETRTSARRIGGRDMREESIMDGNTLIVKLKIGREKFRQYMRDRKAKAKAEQQQQQQHQVFAASRIYEGSQSGASQQGTPVPGSMGPPPATPGLPQQIHQNQQINSFSNSTPQATVAPAIGPPQQQATPPVVHHGRVDAPPPQPGQQITIPPPPTWLNSGLAALRVTYPNDRFEGTMRHTPVDIFTDQPIPSGALQPGQPTPPNVKYQFFPRIRCHDCPGKLYTPGPGMTVENFEVHLKNRQHRERVDRRVKS